MSLIKNARDEAFKYLEQNPGLNANEEARRIKVLKARWVKTRARGSGVIAEKGALEVFL